MIYYEVFKKYLKLFLSLYLFFCSRLFWKKTYNGAFNKNYYYNFSSLKLKYNNLFFNLTDIKYYFSYKYGMVEVEYNIAVYDINKNEIIPSNLALYNDFHILCIIKSGPNTYIKSLTNIYKNKYFNCIEYFKPNKKIKIGINIIYNKEKISTFYFFNHIHVNYNNLKYLNDIIFDCLNINNNYINTFKTKKKINNNNVLLNKIFLLNPICLEKDIYAKKKDIWIFKNLYNHFFCFCYGIVCSYNKIPQECKYLFYLSIINDNKFLYNKTDFLLADFLYEDRAPGDAYLLFREMIKHNISAHYVTERKDIYQEFNNINRESLQIIPIINKQYNITGNTLEKYLNLFLRLKVVISGAEFYSIYNIFYDIEYITFISIGHGVNFFKHFLFSEYYGCKRYNKIILPSNVIIKMAKKYGWTDENILKVGLPKWDYFDNYKNEIKKLSNNINHSYKYSIFIMFTWRELKKQENISPFYFNNIKNLLNNNELNNALKYNNITLYISLHHNLLDKQNVLSLNENIKYINQKDILECLARSNLIITDFSSVIFDFIYQKKPFIIYLPDSNDSNIKNIYTNEYYDIINGLKNDSIYFENKFFNIEDTVKKIIYYINNNFKIEKNLETFYNNFEFNDKNRINTLINYIENMK